MMRSWLTSLAQTAAAEVLKIDQPTVLAPVRGRLSGFSLDRLVRFLVLLGSHVEIVVKPRPGEGQARVVVPERQERYRRSAVFSTWRIARRWLRPATLSRSSSL